MVDGSLVGSLNGTIMAHLMPLAGAVHHITVTVTVTQNKTRRAMHAIFFYYPIQVENSIECTVTVTP